jgi:hypothetical protein
MVKLKIKDELTNQVPFCSVSLPAGKTAKSFTALRPAGIFNSGGFLSSCL